MKEIIERLKTIKSAAVLPHSGPDGDCMGAAFALARIISNDSAVYLNEPLPDSLSFLLGECRACPPGAALSHDAVILLDTADTKLLEEREELFKSAKTTICIDHHPNNNVMADCRWVDPTYAATCEMIYALALEMGVDMDADTAHNLYAGIFTDTGGFRHSNTTPSTHRAAAHLIELGADTHRISVAVYDSESPRRLELYARVIDSIELYSDGRICIITIPKSVREDVGATYDDCDSVTHIPRSIDGVEVGIIIKETDYQTIKWSLRSKNYLDVSEIAAMFGGGGHARASGFSTSVDEWLVIKERLISAIDVKLA